MADRVIKWHLPGFCHFFYLNHYMIDMMERNPEYFHDGYEIGSVYGTFPGAIWNGGRTVFGIAGKNDIVSILSSYKKKEIPVRFTWTNSLIEEKHVYDTYCNLIMELADNGINQVLVNSPILEKYIRETYPNYPVISSTTKRITDLATVQSELEKNYYLVVLDYDLNHDENVLEALKPSADRIEILVNEVCYPGCPKREEHYRQQSLLQLQYDVNTGFPCPNQTQKRTFAECMQRPAFISNEQIGSYIDKGYVNFKIAGRGMPIEYALESYVYFLVKEEYRDIVKHKIENLLMQQRTAKSATKKK